jgi:hypothetical protein
MPYIKQEERLKFDPDLLTVAANIDSPGELNYAITVLCRDYAAYNEPGSYAHYNEIIGVLESAKLEFYRRMAAPYEDKKCKENGDL